MLNHFVCIILLPLILWTDQSQSSSKITVPSQDVPPSKAVWTRKLLSCYLDSHKHLGTEGIEAISDKEIVVYCLKRNTHYLPHLSSRINPDETGQYQLAAFFFDRVNGNPTGTVSWSVKTYSKRPYILPVDDKTLLLADGSAVQLIDRSTLLILKRLLLADPGDKCAPWEMVVSVDRSTFATSKFCYFGTGSATEIKSYRLSDFSEITTSSSPGRNSYDLLGEDMLRTSFGGHGIFLYTNNMQNKLLADPVTVLGANFLDRQLILCCRADERLSVFNRDGKMLTYRDLYPGWDGFHSQNQATQVFVAPHSERFAALVSRTPENFGHTHLECDVFDHSLKTVMSTPVAMFHNDVSAAISPDGQYVFVLVDENVSAYAIPQ